MTSQLTNRQLKTTLLYNGGEEEGNNIEVATMDTGRSLKRYIFPDEINQVKQLALIRGNKVGQVINIEELFNDDQEELTMEKNMDMNTIQNSLSILGLDDKELQHIGCNGFFVPANVFLQSLEGETIQDDRVHDVIGMGYINVYKGSGKKILYIPMQAVMLMRNMQFRINTSDHCVIDYLIKEAIKSTSISLGEDCNNFDVFDFNQLIMFVSSADNNLDLLIIEIDEESVKAKYFSCNGIDGSQIMNSILFYFHLTVKGFSQKKISLYQYKNWVMDRGGINIDDSWLVFLLVQCYLSNKKFPSSMILVLAEEVRHQIMFKLSSSFELINQIVEEGSSKIDENNNEGEKENICMIYDEILSNAFPKSALEVKNILKSKEEISTQYIQGFLHCLSLLSSFVGVHVNKLMTFNNEETIDQVLEEYFDYNKKAKNLSIFLFPLHINIDDMSLFSMIRVDKNNNGTLIHVFDSHAGALLENIKEIYEEIALNLYNIINNVSLDKSDMYINLGYSFVHFDSQDCLLLRAGSLLENKASQQCSAVIMLLEMVNIFLNNKLLSHRDIFTQDLLSFWMELYRIIARECIHELVFDGDDEVINQMKEFCRFGDNQIKVEHTMNETGEFKLINFIKTTIGRSWVEEVCVLTGSYVDLMEVSQLYLDNGVYFRETSGGKIMINYNNNSIGTDNQYFIIIKNKDKVKVELLSCSFDLIDHENVINYWMSGKSDKSDIGASNVAGHMNSHVRSKEPSSGGVLVPNGFTVTSRKRKQRKRKYRVNSMKNTDVLKAFDIEYQNEVKMVTEEGQVTEDLLHDKRLEVCNAFFPPKNGMMDKTESKVMEMWLDELPKSKKKAFLKREHEFEELTAIQFVETKGTFNCFVLEGERVGKSPSREIDYDLASQFFNKKFLSIVMSKPGDIFAIPIGDSTSDIPDKHITTELTIKYYQHEENFCFVYGIASALNYLGFSHERLIPFLDKAKEISNYSLSVAFPYLKRELNKFVPELSNGTWYNSNKYGKRRSLSLESILEPQPMLTIVLPVGCDGCKVHAVAIVDDLIFDSAAEHVLKLTKESLDWSCRGKVLGLAEVVRYQNIPAKIVEKGTKQKNPLYRRELKRNWSYPCVLV